MIRTLTAASTVAICMAAAPAFAAGPTPIVEPVVVAPPPPVGTDWTGGWVGGQLGWGWASTDLSLEDDIDTDLDGDGVIGGLTSGYLYDFGNFVLGGELQYDWANIEFDEIDIEGDDFETVIELDDESGTLEEMFRAKVIAGYDLGSTLVYGSAGYAHATAELAGEDVDGDGWVVGLGADYLIRENITIGGEVMYHQFDDFGGDGLDMDATTLQAKMTFRF
jgi:outer membrane autotransporter protein